MLSRRLSPQTSDRRSRPAPAVLLALVLCACGGGGGGGSGGGDGPLPPAAFETREYQASWGLARIRASRAYSAGATGRGVTVGVIDTGIDAAHPEFAGALDPASINIVSGAGGARLEDGSGHGTAVAGLIAARKNDRLGHGVAFDGRLLVVRADDGISCETGCLFRQSDVARATDHAIANGARIINLSLGGAASLSPPLDTALTRAVDQGAIVVVSAGNGGDAQPSFPARFAADPRARGQVVAVGALDTSNQLASFSNRAGDAADVFLAAPGAGLLAPAPGGGTQVVSGTSFAAPHVSGAAALVLEAAPFLSAGQVVEILLESAVDLGTPGTDPVYGRGLVDVGRALRPQGALQVPQGERVEGDLAPLEGAGLALGTAFGSGPALGEVLVLDAYGRPYRLDLADRTGAVTGRRTDLERHLAPPAGLQTAVAGLAPGLELDLVRGEAPAGEPAAPGPLLLSLRTGDGSELAVSRCFGVARRFGLAGLEPAVHDLVGATGLVSPYLALADGGEALTLHREVGEAAAVGLAVATARPGASGPLEGAERAVVVAEVVRGLPGEGEVALHLGSVLERGSLLDSRSGGALALPREALTRFAGVSGRIPLGGGFDLLGQASLGLTTPAGSGGLLDELSALHSSTFAVGLARHGLIREGDRAVLALVQPVRIEHGSALLDRPLERTLEGEVIRRRERIGLEPGGRELDLEFGYTAGLGSGRTVALNWLTRLEPGHDRRQPPEHVLALRLRAPL